MWYVYIEDTSNGGRKVPASFCASEQSKYQFSFPIYKDPGAAVLGSITGPTHTNVIIRTSDMKITYKNPSHDLNSIGTVIERDLP